jgi:hypothetical protein
MNIYFLEHPTKGICVDIPFDRDESFHWSWSKPRSEARMLSLAQARKFLSEVPKGTKIMRDDGPGLDVRYKEAS